MSHFDFSSEERDTLSAFLHSRLDNSEISEIRESLSKEGGGSGKSAEWMLADYIRSEGSDFDPRLEKSDFIDFLLSYKGSDIFSLPGVRKAVYRKASPLQIDRLADFLDEPNRMHPAQMIEQLEKRRWRIGSSYARYFVRVFNLPEVFAGFTGLPAPAELVEVPPFRPLPDLAPFQVPIKEEIFNALRSNLAHRAMVTLPTGAGKTRSVVEGLMTWLAFSFTEEKTTILWVAQSDELCEQAVGCFEEVWRDLGHRDEDVRESLLINRFWGGRRLSLNANVVVASIQKLHATLLSENESEDFKVLGEMRSRLKVMLVDEAHRSTSTSYKKLFNFLEAENSGSRNCSYFGLSATPYRADAMGTKELSSQFYRNLIEPEIFGTDPLKWLRDEGYLAQVERKIIKNVKGSYALDSNQKYLDYFSDFQDVHPELLSEIASNGARNRLIVDTIKELPLESSVLLFACSVEHAIAIALMLDREQISSRAITSAMRSPIRRDAIERFRAKEIRVLTNFGVLTTGFDAPTIDTVIIARPTASSVLYEQMIGRGMRGPQFGGTPKCLVIDVEDNLRFKGQMASTRHREEWMSEN